MSFRTVIAMIVFVLPVQVVAHDEDSGVQRLDTTHPFQVLEERMIRAIAENQMGLVTHASRGARARGLKIPGNAVLGVFRNDYAVRMLKASVAAGIEAPLRIYLTENADGSATLRYRLPSVVFAPYEKPELDRLARELDEVFARIVADAVGR